MKTFIDRATGNKIAVLAEMTILEMDSRIVRIDRGAEFGIVVVVQINVDDGCPASLTGSVLDPWEDVGEYPFTEDGLKLALQKFGALASDLPDTMGADHLKDLADDV